MGTLETKMKKKKKKNFLERSLYGHIVKNDIFTEQKIAHYKISKVCNLSAFMALSSMKAERNVCIKQRQKATGVVISAPETTSPTKL